MNNRDSAEIASSEKRSMFWRVAAVLLAAQAVTGLLAIFLSANYSLDRSRELAESSVREKINTLAEEIERLGRPFSSGLSNLPLPLSSNLSLRFPDPVYVLDEDGQLVDTFYPSSVAFPDIVLDTTRAVQVPDTVVTLFDSGQLGVDGSSEIVDGGWAAAPVYDALGFMVGGILIQPLSESIERELAPTQDAYRNATITLLVLALLIATILAALFTWWLIKPIRAITQRVEEIGAGDYEVRAEVRGDDEIARLGRSVNQMAERVSASIETLKTSDQLRRELVANVGHDLRTPLAALKAHLEEGVRFHKENRLDAAFQSLEAAQNQGDYLERLIHDLFELSQLENPAVTMRWEPVPVSELLGEVIQRHRKRIENDGIEFHTDVPADLPVIQADGTRLLRLFDNVLINAVEYTERGGKISLDAEAVLGDVIIRVSDSGSGISADQLEKIFDRYYRGTQARTRGRSGTGLGLAISRAVARSHGGDLSVESEPGQGTIFTLVLPARSNASD